MNPLASIVVPCFNMERWLPETLQSVLAQTFRDWECLIVDDGSTDGSAAVAEGWCARDGRFRLLRQPNAGVAAARNAGVAASAGRYLLFLDADDLLAPGYLEAAVAALEADPSLTLVYGAAPRFKGAPDRTIPWDLPPFSMGTMLSRNCLYVSCVLRRADFDRTAGFDPAFGAGYEDWDFWLSLFEALPGEPRVLRLEQPCLYYRTRHGSRNARVTDTVLKDIRRRLWDKHKNLYAKYFPDPLQTAEYQRLKRSFDKAARWSLAWKLRLLWRRLFS